jgi:hypothetical protein
VTFALLPPRGVVEKVNLYVVFCFLFAESMEEEQANANVVMKYFNLEKADRYRRCLGHQIDFKYMDRKWQI